MKQKKGFLKYYIKIGNSYNSMLIVAFLIGVLLIASSYAWLSSSLNVRVNFLNMKVDNDSGLSISFDGVNFFEKVSAKQEIVMDELLQTYPNHSNQWARRGLLPVSTLGIHDNNSSKFTIFGNSRVARYKDENDKVFKFIRAHQFNEDKPRRDNHFVAFDLFLRNKSGSPMPDNLFFNTGTGVYFNGLNQSDYDGTFNSMRIGMVKIGTVPTNSPREVVQNIQCNNQCEMVIYEPNATAHSEGSIERSVENGITLYNGIANPTYAIRKEGENLNIVTGHAETGIQLDNEYFGIQNTITNINNPIFKLPDGITKFRVYVWIEGQDVDSLETVSSGLNLAVVINFFKDIAGYEYYND